METYIRNAVEKIKNERIRPIAPWKLWCVDCAPWLLVVIAVVISGFAAAFVFHIVNEIDWNVYRTADISWYKAAIFGAPLFWIFSFAVCVIAAIAALRKTRRGYRYPSLGLWVMFFFLSGFSGFAMELAEVNDPVQKFLLNNVPNYEKFRKLAVPSEEEQWSRPETGLLGGQILEITEEKIEIEDANKRQWTVERSSTRDESEPDLKKDDKIKVIGKEKDTKTFKAEEIRQWKKRETGSSIKSDDSEKKDSRKERQEDDRNDKESDKEEEDKESDKPEKSDDKDEDKKGSSGSDKSDQDDEDTER